MCTLVAKFLILALHVQIIVRASSLHGKTRTKLSVYYETLCPDSIRFVRNQLKPLMTSNIGKYIDLELVPYGKAHPCGLEESRICCQHGPEECRGNMIQSCALKLYKPEDAKKFVYCTMTKRNPPDEGESCSGQLGLSYAEVKQCSKSHDGMKYLTENGRKTTSLTPKLNFVPWIVFNNIWNEEKMERSQKDLKGVVCEMIGQKHCT